MTSSGTYYLNRDGLGSVVSITDSAGAVVESYEYSTFGEPTIKNASGTVISTSAIGNTFMFTGRMWDDVLQLYDYRARVYNPKFGVFYQTDPLGYADSTNMYAYCVNDPVNFVDPYGLTKIYVDIEDGVMTVDPEKEDREPYQMSITSGKDEAMNNPKYSNQKNKGPIPEGNYVINSNDLSDPGIIKDIRRNFPKIGGDWGDWRVPLSPLEGTDTCGRDGFFLHGGAFLGSAGCIDFGGGLLGNEETDRLKEDILDDSDGTVPVYIR